MNRFHASWPAKAAALAQKVAAALLVGLGIGALSAGVR